MAEPDRFWAAPPIGAGPRVLAVLGPTAAGKSALGLALAEAPDLGADGGGEILCCDSMQIYQGLDVGTGKATLAERARVPHHLLDRAAPPEAYHAARWADEARAAIAEIGARGRLPIIVGGTGLYFRALVQGLFVAPPSDPAIRARHDAEAAREGLPALHARLAGVDPAAAARIMPNDLLRISRALEVFEQTGVPLSVLQRSARPPLPLDLVTVVLDPPLPILRVAIEARVDEMMAAGFLAEVAELRAAGFAAARALAGLGYRQLGEHLDGALTLADAVAETKRVTVAYARRQRTWFRKETAALRVTARFDDANAASVVRSVFAAIAARWPLR